MAGGLKLAPLLTEIKVDIAGFKSDMSKAAVVGVTEAERIGKSMETATRTGEVLSKSGAMLTRGLTIPLAGVAIATGKMAVDFESNFAKVSTLLDSNVVDFGDYKTQLLDASGKSKVAVGEFSESVYQSISAGVDQTKAIGFTTDAMKLAKGGFTDGAKAVDILTTAINGYGKKSEDSMKISDMLITTQNLGKTTVDELATSMGAVIPVADSVNFGMEELSASYAQLTKNGIATAESGTYLKAMLSELGKSGSDADVALRELTGKGFAQLKEEGVPTADILKQLGDYAENNGKTLKDMFGSVEAGTAALVLGKGDGTEYNQMLDAMNGSAGATQEAFEKMDATPAEQLKGALNELKNEGIKFGKAFIPVIESAADTLSNVADAFSGLSDEQQQNVIKWGAVLVAVGPVMSIAGKSITTFTSLTKILGGAGKALGVFGTSSKIAAAAAAGTAEAAGAAAAAGSGLMGSFTGLLGTCAPLALGVAVVGTGIYALHESNQLMSRSVLDSKEELSGMEKVLARLNGTEVKSREEMEELGWVHEEFSDVLSPKFQKSVEESTKKVQDFNIFLSEIGFDKVITQAESDEFNARINKMCDEAIQTIQSKKEEGQKALKELFVADDGTVDEGEQRVLEILSQSSDAQVAEVTQLKADILAIEQKAVDDGRALSDEEVANIEASQARIRQIELENLGSTQEEVMYAKNEFSARVKTLDAESAASLLQEKAKTRDEEIVQTQATYDTQIEMLKAKSAAATAEEKVALDDQIANLETDKEVKIQSQKDLYEQYLQIIKDSNPKLLDAINKFDGKVLTQKDLQSQSELKRLQSRYEGLDQITKSGCYRMYNTVTGSASDVAVKIDEKTGEVIGIYDRTNNETGGYCEKMGKSAEDMANKQGASFQQIIGEHARYDESSGNIVLANGEVVGSLKDVKIATDGTKTGIVDINGTPYSIKVNKDGTIGALNEISSAADETAKTRTITFRPLFEDGGILNHYMPKIPESTGFNGFDNIPYDGFRARLHKGERVLTAEENKQYTNGQDNVDYGAIQSIVRKELGNIVLQIGDREAGRAVSRLSKDRGI